MLTDVDKMFSDSDMESEGDGDFAAENAPRPPPETLMYGGKGKFSPEGRDIAQVERPGRSNNGGGTGPGNPSAGERSSLQAGGRDLSPSLNSGRGRKGRQTQVARQPASAAPHRLAGGICCPA